MRNSRSNSVAALIAIVGLAACSRSEEVTAERTLTGEEACASESTVVAIHDLIFDEARSLDAGRDTVAMNDLQREAVSSLAIPLLQEENRDLQRTTCTGRLRMDLPTGTLEVFGTDEILADITYSLQPAADGSGTVYSVDGAGDLVQNLAFADLSTWTRSSGQPPTASSARAVAPQATAAVEVDGAMMDSYEEPSNNQSFRPSFDCSRATVRAEELICSTESIAHQDRTMAAAYSAARGLASAEERRRLQEDQRGWLQERNRCQDDDCLFDLYSRRIAELNADPSEAVAF